MPTWPLYIAPTIPSTASLSAIEQTRRDLLLRTATGSNLTTIGQNYGIPRPALLSNDAMYSRCVQALAWRPKTILATTEALMSAVFGSKQSIVASGGRAWQIYEVRGNEIIVEVPTTLLSITPEVASYYHGWDGYAYNASGVTSDTFTTEGDVSTCTTVALTTLDAVVLVGGIWTNYGIVASSYNTVTKRTTIQLDASVIPDGGTLFHIVPTSSDSFTGDYVAPSGLVNTFFTDPGVGTTTNINIWGNVSAEFQESSSVRIIYNGQTYTATLGGEPSYVAAQPPPTIGDYTILALSISVPEGLTEGLLIRDVERADIGTAVVHDDRLYFTDKGLYAVFEYYYLTLVKAANVVLRFEQI